MTDFIRARSDAQKQQRMDELGAAAEKLYLEGSYPSITLSSIAEELGWARGNLYKYVTTKEEIFLNLYIKAQEKCFGEFESALRQYAAYSPDSFAELCVDVMARNRLYLKYYNLLSCLLETNVPYAKLVSFKKATMALTVELMEVLSSVTGLSQDKAAELFWSLIFHGVGLDSICSVKQEALDAMADAGYPPPVFCFEKMLKEYLTTYLKGLRPQDESDGVNNPTDSGGSASPR